MQGTKKIEKKNTVTIEVYVPLLYYAHAIW
jgi:hypothetical protein